MQLRRAFVTFKMLKALGGGVEILIAVGCAGACVLCVLVIHARGTAQRPVLKCRTAAGVGHLVPRHCTLSQHCRLVCIGLDQFLRKLLMGSQGVAKRLLLKCGVG